MGSAELGSGDWVAGVAVGQGEGHVLEVRTRRLSRGQGYDRNANCQAECHNSQVHVTNEHHSGKTVLFSQHLLFDWSASPSRPDQYGYGTRTLAQFDLFWILHSTCIDLSSRNKKHFLRLLKMMSLIKQIACPGIFS